MSKVDNLLNRLTKVKSTGKGSWLACCPAHEDRTPSLTVREIEHDHILFHCFAGCEPEKIIGAVGLDWKDVMPDKAGEPRKPIRRPFPAADVLEAVDLEASIVWLVARKLVLGEQVDENDLARVQLAANRIHEARSLAIGEI